MTPTETEALAGRIDQIIGWAKSGIRGEYYLMDRENVDTMRDDILRAMTPSASDARWNRLREEIRHLRTAAYDVATELSDEGKDAFRAFGRVDAYDEVLKRMDRAEADR